jgi:hypothetical protein
MVPFLLSQPPRKARKGVPLLTFTKRLHESGLSYADLSFIVNISEDRLKEYARGRTDLSSAELERVYLAFKHKPIVYTIWKRAVETGKAPSG